jgi:hypothetical protein
MMLPQKRSLDKPLCVDKGNCMPASHEYIFIISAYLKFDPGRRSSSIHYSKTPDGKT